VPYFDIVDPGRQVHLGTAAELAGISRDDMFALNPAFNRMTTPPHGPHRLLLPIPNADSSARRCSTPCCRRRACWWQPSSRPQSCVTAWRAARP
jgi:membrane-bound lytic murein transglycosylase D